MKKQKIKALPVVKEFANYIIGRAKRVLKISNEEFETVSIDVHPECGTIWVWFHYPTMVIGRVQFYFNGRCYEKTDYRK